MIVFLEKVFLFMYELYLKRKKNSIYKGPETPMKRSIVICQSQLFYLCNGRALKNMIEYKQERSSCGSEITIWSIENGI